MFPATAPAAAPVRISSRPPIAVPIPGQTKLPITAPVLPPAVAAEKPPAPEPSKIVTLRVITIWS